MGDENDPELLPPDAEPSNDTEDDNNIDTDEEGQVKIRPPLYEQKRNGRTMYLVPRRKRKHNPDPDLDLDQDLEQQPTTPEEIAYIHHTFLESLTKEEYEYWDTLSYYDRGYFIDKMIEVKKSNKHEMIPLKFKILEANLGPSITNILLNKLTMLNTMNPMSSEYFKNRNWFQALSRLPLGKYNMIPLTSASPPRQCADFLLNVKNILESHIYGHTEAKNQVLRILAQWISNPSSRGHCIGIQGPMGTGKTSFVKDGLSKALGIPFGFIPLGGASDASFLLGHNFTYEGSMYGKIAQTLMTTQCMNPILLFDELDKVSDTARGEEIIGILTHLTDSTQNERFTDKYFGEVEMDLSKALMIFSYNDESRVNPILKDRMITIRISGYNQNDKIQIAKHYLIPHILKQYMYGPSDVIFTEDVLISIINRIPKEDGVRNLKRGIESIVGWLNMNKYLSSDPAATPIHITNDHVTQYISLDDSNNSQYLSTMYM